MARENVGPVGDLPARPVGVTPVEKKPRERKG
jgi:hypothetical protein